MCFRRLSVSLLVILAVHIGGIAMSFSSLIVVVGGFLVGVAGHLYRPSFDGSGLAKKNVIQERRILSSSADVGVYGGASGSYFVHPSRR